MADFTVSAKLVVDNTQGVRSIEEERAAFARLGQTIRELDTGSAVLARINSSVGVRDDFGTAARAADVAAYGSALDDLRAKFNPLFAAERQHLAVLEEIARAQRVGAISAEEEVAAVAREATAYDQLTNSLRARQQVAAGGAGSFQTANVAAQFQDIGVTAAMGMNPLQIGLQQGTQLAAAFGNEGAAGAAKLLGSAVMSLISPVSLFTIAAVAAGAAGLQWFSSLRSNAKSTEDALKEHDALVEQIRRSWDSAGVALDAYTKRSPSLLASGAREDVKQMQAQLKTVTDHFLDSVAGRPLAPGSEYHDFSGKLVDYLIDSTFKPFSDAIENLRDQVKNGTPDLDAFYEALDRKVTADPGLQDLADRLKTASKDAYDLANSLGQARTAAAIAGDGIAQTFAKVDEDNAKARARTPVTLSDLDFGLRGLAEGEKAAQAHQIEMDAINAKSPAELADIARRRTALELADDQISASLRQQKIDQAGAEAYAQAAHSIGEASTNRLRAAEQNILSAQLDLDTIGKSVEQTERLKFVQQQLFAAELEAAQTGTTVTEGYRQRVEALGKAWGETQAAIATGKLGSDLAFERDQLGRSDIDQQVAEKLRPIFGNDLTSAQAQFLGQQIRINAELADFKSIASDVTSSALSTLKTDLMNGVSLFDALGDAGSNAFSKIADKALSLAADQAVNWLFNSIASAITGGVGGINLGTALAGGVLGHNAAGTDYWRGGLTSINERGGEIVDLPTGTRIIPHDVSMQMASNGGAISGGRSGNTYYVDARGAQQGVAEQIVAALRAYDDALPDRLADMQHRGAI